MDDRESMEALRELAKKHPDTLFSKRFAIGMVVGTFAVAGILYFAVNQIAAIICVVVGVVFMIPLAIATYFASIKTSMKKIEVEKQQELKDYYASRGEYVVTGYTHNDNPNRVGDKVANVLLNVGASYALGKAVTKVMDEKPIIKLPKSNARDVLTSSREARYNANNIGKSRTKVTLTTGKGGWLEPTANGSLVLVDLSNNRVARYDSVKNETTDGRGHVVGKGNLLGKYYR